MSTSIRQSRNLVVHQSTGKHTFSQKLRYHVSRTTDAPGGPGGHSTLSFCNTVVRVAIDASGGTFTMTLAGVTTGDIPYDAEPADLTQALIVAWPDDAAGKDNFLVRGDVGNYIIELKGQFQYQNVTVETDPSSLSGGAGTAAVTVIQTGNGGTPNDYKKNDGFVNDKLQESATLAYGNIFNPSAPVGQLVRTGTITPPTAPPGAEENTRAIWRKTPKSSRLGLSQA